MSEIGRVARMWRRPEKARDLDFVLDFLPTFLSMKKVGPGYRAGKP